MKRPYEFAKMTWEEVNAAVLAQKPVLIPAATIEDHGLHLPIDTDVMIAESICRATAEKMPDGVVLLPPITVGFSPHHIDGPGVLTARWDVFIEYVRGMASNLTYHGFRKILIVNGHGSNRPALDLAARLTNVDNPDTHCAFLSWWELRRVQERVAAFRQSEWTGHACELETSIYLAVEPENVAMDKARVDLPPNRSPHFWADLVGQPPPGYANAVGLTEYWSTVSETGTWGDPTVATAEKGREIIAAASDELVEILREFVALPVRERVAHQLPHATERNRALGLFHPGRAYPASDAPAKE